MQSAAVFRIDAHLIDTGDMAKLAQLAV